MCSLISVANEVHVVLKELEHHPQSRCTQGELMRGREVGAWNRDLKQGHKAGVWQWPRCIINMMWSRDMTREHKGGTWGGNTQWNTDTGTWSEDIKRWHKAETWSGDSVSFPCATFPILQKVLLHKIELVWISASRSWGQNELNLECRIVCIALVKGGEGKTWILAAITKQLDLDLKGREGTDSHPRLVLAMQKKQTHIDYVARLESQESQSLSVLRQRHLYGSLCQVVTYDGPMKLGGGDGVLLGRQSVGWYEDTIRKRSGPIIEGGHSPSFGVRSSLGGTSLPPNLYWPGNCKWLPKDKTPV